MEIENSEHVSLNRRDFLALAEGLISAMALGACLGAGTSHAAAVTFAEGQRPMPVAYFLACMTLREPTQENMAKALAYLDPVLKTIPEIKPVRIGAFAGALDYSHLSWLTKRIMKSKDAPEGDFRDWKAIRAWAEASVFAKSIQ